MSPAFRFSLLLAMASTMSYSQTNSGIGTVVPTAKLEIRGNGTTSATNSLKVTRSDSTPTFIVNDAGKAGIGIASPSAFFHLPAGAAAAGSAPLKFTSGINLTTAEAGAIEFNGTSLFYTNSTPTRITLLGNNLGIAGGSSLIGGTIASENLTLLSTSHATKGKIIMGTSAYDEFNNRLGIGTVAPNIKLEIEIGSVTANTSIAYFGGQTTSNFGTSLLVSNRNTAGWAGVFLNETASNSGLTPGGLIRFNSTHATRAGEVALLSSTDLTFGTGASQSERMRITQTGNVGIGTIAPQAPLNVFKTPTTGFVEAFRIGGTANYRSLDMGTWGSYDAYMSTYGNDLHILAGRAVATENHNIHFYTSFNGANGQAESNERMTIQWNGNVGIGTILPVANARLAIKDGHLQSQQTTAPVVGTKVTYTTASLSNATDVAGNVSITTTAAAGSVTFNFNKTYTVAPIVVLTPTVALSTTDIAKVFVTSTTSGFTVNFTASPAAGVHTFNYIVVETQ